MTIETARLRLRAPEPRDFDRLWEMLTDPVAKRYTGGVTRMGRADRRALFLADCAAPFTPEETEFAVADRASDEYLGYCGIRAGEDGDEPELLYGYRRDVWGRGVGLEAARAALGFFLRAYPHDAYCATADAENPASVRILERLGFRRAGLSGDGFPLYRLRREDFLAE